MTSTIARPASHDLVAMPAAGPPTSPNECSDLAITNLPDTRHAVAHQVQHPQRHVRRRHCRSSPPLRAALAGSPGRSRVKVADKLMVAPILLPGLEVTASASSRGGKITAARSRVLPAAGRRRGRHHGQAGHELARGQQVAAAGQLGPALRDAARRRADSRNDLHPVRHCQVRLGRLARHRDGQAQVPVLPEVKAGSPGP